MRHVGRGLPSQYIILSVRANRENASLIVTKKLMTRMYDVLLFQKGKATVSLSCHMCLSLLMTFGVISGCCVFLESGVWRNMTQN